MHMLKSSLLALLLTAGFPGMSRAAQPALESFSPGNGGWEGLLTMGGGSWSIGGGLASVTFYDTRPIAIPDTAVLEIRSGAFTGNYERAGIDWIGFRVRSTIASPSGVLLAWGNDEGEFQRSFSLEPSSSWQILTASLAPEDRTYWTPVRGGFDAFDQVRSAVQFVKISFLRSGVSENTIEVDEVYLGLRQVAGGMTMTGLSGASIAWSSLVTTMNYRVQSTTNLETSWTTVLDFEATNEWMQFEIPGGDGVQFWRLVSP